MFLNVHDDKLSLMIWQVLDVLELHFFIVGGLVVVVCVCLTLAFQGSRERFVAVGTQ